MVFHVKIDKKRTTVTISDFLADVLAISLVDKLAHEAVIDVVGWLQCKIDLNPEKYGSRVSQRLQDEILVVLCQKSIYRRYLQLDIVRDL